MFNFFNIPSLIIAFLLTGFIFVNPVSDDPLADVISRVLLTFALTVMPLITVGPSQAGMTFILRNYSKEEHAFVWLDFKDTAISNLKQSLIISCIDLVVILIAIVDFAFYYKMADANPLRVISSAVMFLVLIIFLMMHLYIYPIMVTFKLKITEILKNAAIFAIVEFLPNIMILIVIYAVLILTFISPLIGLVLYIFITPALIGLIINFFTYPKINKHMLKKMNISEKR